MALLIRVYALLIHVLMVGFVAGNVVLMAKNISLSFRDVEANFMRGTQDGIKIHSVFISKASGKMLKEYIDRSDVEAWILSNSENRPLSIKVVSFLALLAVVVGVATCLHGRNVIRERFIASRVQEFQGMSGSLVKAMRSMRFTNVLEDNCTSSACAICLEDYSTGEKLRILPCHHMFHAICVDSWLTSWRTFCPVCKRDARTSINIPPASEFTPLLSSDTLSPSSSTPISSLVKSLPVPTV
ncbi:receptor homology region, transmembrane domain- and RING domain-containing protein 1-like [Asparagus officinalis]|nr:receptor homology region, transmembrane domain- and RING domain-containing protein 1-like [Asparagus officinalis]